MLSSNIRDPFRTALEDWAGLEPFQLDVMPFGTNVSNLGRGTSGRGFRGGNRLMSVDCYEDQGNFTVMCEVIDINY